MAQDGVVANVAVAVKLLFVTRLQEFLPLQAPLHPVNVRPAAAVAFNVIELPLGYAALQVPLPLVQLITPSVLVTVPCPTSLTESVYCDATVAKLAVAVRLPFTVTLQGLLPLQAPLHPENVQPVAAVALIVTEVPFE